MGERWNLSENGAECETRYRRALFSLLRGNVRLLSENAGKGGFCAVLGWFGGAGRCAGCLNLLDGWFWGILCRFTAVYASLQVLTSVYGGFTVIDGH